MRGITKLLATAGLAVALAGCSVGTLRMDSHADDGGSTVTAENANRGLSATGKLDIPDGYHLHVSSDMKSGVVRLSASNPESQDVVVDDSVSGKYEHDYAVAAGSYDLSVSVAGTEAATGKVEIVPEKNLEWNEELAQKMREFADMLEGQGADSSETQQKAEEVSKTLESRTSGSVSVHA